MSELKKTVPMRGIKSFVKRDSRMSATEKEAMIKLFPLYGVVFEKTAVSLADIFKREAPRILEIGFGSGFSLLEIAKQMPEKDFLGVEMYQPGVATLLLNIEKNHLNNLKIFYADAVEVLQFAIPENSLDGVQIFFPDPWQKRKHHKRRLIQPGFVNLVASRLKTHGIFHLATDWEDYAVHMMRVLSKAEGFLNLAGHEKFSPRSDQRPIVTKFEARGAEVGRIIWELQFVKC